MEYITAAEAARRFGINPDYAARLAKRSYSMGNTWPIKEKGTWIAPLSAWDEIFHPKHMKIRKKRTIVENVENIEKIKTKPEQLLTAKDFSEIVNYSHSWITQLAHRAMKEGYGWPKKTGSMLIAPKKEWEIIVLSNKFKKRSNNYPRKSVKKFT